MNADVAIAALSLFSAATSAITTMSSRMSAPMNSGIPVLVRNSCESVFVRTAETAPVTTSPPNIQAKTERTNEMSDAAPARCSTKGGGVEALNSMAPMLEGDRDRLGLEVGVEALATVLAPDAGGLEAAERQARVAAAPVVDVDRPGAQQR